MRNDNTVSIREAAKLIHKSRRYVRELVESGKVTALHVGGSKASPLLRIDADELRRVVRREQVYVPNGMTKIEIINRRRPARAFTSGVHPEVDDW